MALTFKGGLFLDEKKNTTFKKIENFPYVDEYRLPLCQHTGDPSTPVVSEGDRVLVGQKIADDEGHDAANIHSPVSGIVTEVVEGNDKNCGYISIKNDYLNEKSPYLAPFGEKSGKTVDQLTIDDLISVVRKAGICGMSGAGIPTWKKLYNAVGKVRRIIVNCVECEPYITVNHRLLVEDTKSVIGGLKILLYAFRIRNATIAITNRDNGLVKLLKKELAGDEINLRVLSNKYPQGDERQLIYSLTGREVPKGRSGIDLGILTLNAQTVSEIYNAFVFGTPSIYRSLTVDGDVVDEPMNLKVPIGTPTSEILDFCGIKNSKQAIRVIHGGIMMGKAVESSDAPVIKTTTAILAFKDNSHKNIGSKGLFADNVTCIKCARCVDVCPMRLIPSDFARCIEKNKPDLLKKYGADICVLCGLCEYVCPTGIALLDYIRYSKNCDQIEAQGGNDGKNG